MKLRALVAPVPLALSMVACSHAIATAPARPDAPTASEALDAPRLSAPPVRRAVCPRDAERGDPLVVDLRPEERGSLELAMREGIAVVAFDCNGLRVLDACTLRGSYGFTSFAPKEQVVRLESSEELRANLPFSGALLSAQIGAELARGATLDVALVMLGRSRTTRTSAKVKDLHGTCAEATHFVRGAFVGAFAMETGSRAQSRTAVEILRMGASAQDSSRKRVQQRDGSVEQCRGGSATRTTPRGCALLRLQLLEIERQMAKVPVLHEIDDVVGAVSAVDSRRASAPAGAWAPGPEEPACPFDFVESGGKCVADPGAGVHACSAGDSRGCEKPCEGGDVEACLRVARELAETTDAKKGLRARDLYARACAAGRPEGCAGEVMLARRGVGANDSARTMQLLEQACEGGLAAECAELGRRAGGQGGDPARAVRAYERGCNGGSADACTELGIALALGRGVPADPARALVELDRACVGEDERGCEWLRVRREKR